MVENDELKGTELEGEDQVEDAPNDGDDEEVESPEADVDAEDSVDEGGPPTARLVLKRNGVETDMTFEFRPPATVGRFDPTVGPVDVDLASLDEAQYISRKHARITLSEEGWLLEDLGSSNGSYVLRGDFERVESSPLVDGDEVAFGNARFVFRVSES